MAEEKKKEVLNFGGTKDGVTVTAKKNISLATIVRGDPALERDEKVRRGGRVERGTEMCVPKPVAARLKKFGYAAMIAFLMLVTSSFSYAQTDTTNVALTPYQGSSYCAYTASIDLGAVDSTGTYETRAFFIGDMDSAGITALISPAADTVAVTVDVSNDLTNWYTYAWADADSVTTKTHLDFNPAGFDGFRYASFDVGWTNGSVDTSTIEAFVRKRTGSEDNCHVVNR